jgi:hypothetical protein
MMASNAASVGLKAALIFGCGLMLAGCESARFGGRGPTVAARQPPSRIQQPEPAAVEAIPAESVTSEPLAPPPGNYATPAPAQSAPAPVVADVPIMPGTPRPVEPMVPEAVAPAAAPQASNSRSANVGAWTAREASGTSCRLQLSSAPALDLYKASASGCANKDLARVTGWDFRDGEVYLYQPGGAVAARLRSSSGSLQGVLAKSGAPLTLSRS